MAWNLNVLVTLDDKHKSRWGADTGDEGVSEAYLFDGEVVNEVVIVLV